MRRQAILKAVALLIFGIINYYQIAFAAQDVPNSDFKSFKICVDREVKIVVNRSIIKSGELALYGYHTVEENEVISVCNPRLKPESMLDSSYTTDRSYSYVNAAIEALFKAAINDKIKKEIEKQRKQDALDASSLKINKAEEDEEFSHYVDCLKRHAKIMALNSNVSLATQFDGRTLVS